MIEFIGNRWVISNSKNIKLGNKFFEFFIIALFKKEIKDYLMFN